MLAMLESNVQVPWAIREVKVDSVDNASPKPEHECRAELSARKRGH
jgi:hypothetical protein